MMAQCNKTRDASSSIGSLEKALSGQHKKAIDLSVSFQKAIMTRSTSLLRASIVAFSKAPLMHVKKGGKKEAVLR